MAFCVPQRQHCLAFRGQEMHWYLGCSNRKMTERQFAVKLACFSEKRTHGGLLSSLICIKLVKLCFHPDDIKPRPSFQSEPIAFVSLIWNKSYKLPSDCHFMWLFSILVPSKGSLEMLMLNYGWIFTVALPEKGPRRLVIYFPSMTRYFHLYSPRVSFQCHLSL